MRLSKFINKYFFNKEIDTVDPTYTIENINKGKSKDSLKEGDVIYASLSTTVKENGKKKRLNQRKDLYMLKDSYGKLTFVDYLGNEYKTSLSSVKLIESFTKEKDLNDLLDTYERDIKEAENRKYLEESKKLGFTFSDLDPDEKLRKVIQAGIKNIWMVGPAGCGNKRY